MYLAPEGHEIEIANAAADFLAGAMPIDRLHAPDSADMAAPLRQRLGDMGWFGLAVPESRGGSGLSAVEHALFFREVGRQCGPVDILAQCLATNAIADEALRTQVISGQMGVALAVADSDSYRLLGQPEADYALLVSPEITQLFPLSGIGAAARPALDPANSMHVTSALPAPVESLPGEHIWCLAQLSVAAMLVGLAEASLDLIVEYAKVRETFGRKIGSWQAVRHPCADMAVTLEAARAQLWYAAAALKEGRADADVHLDAAKHLANQAALGNADINIQLHGGIGVTAEHNAHLLLKRALVLSRLFGAKRGLLGRLLHARLDG
jgi:alkylation response protein AidB-like acyl-CoA dehydrogenase